MCNLLYGNFCLLLASDLKRAHANLEAMKKQVESTNREYDRLAQENQTLQVRSIILLFHNDLVEKHPTTVSVRG